MSLLQSFIDKNRVNVSEISFIEPIASFHEIQNITKMSFNLPLRNKKRKHLLGFTCFNLVHQLGI
jgi:gluconate kinase